MSKSLSNWRNWKEILSEWPATTIGIRSIQLPQKLHFRIGYFYSFGATQSNSSQSCNPRPRISSKQLFFARLARPIQQIFIRSIRSRGTEHPNSIERRSWNLVGHKWSSNISPGNWFVKFKAITPVVNFHEFFSCFLDTWMNSWMKFFLTLCHPWRRTSKTSSVVGANLETSSSWQIKNNHSNSR